MPSDSYPSTWHDGECEITVRIDEESLSVGEEVTIRIEGYGEIECAVVSIDGKVAVLKGKSNAQRSTE